MFRIDNSTRIHLTSVRRTGFQDLAGLGGFGRASRCRSWRPGTIIQIKKIDLMSEGGEESDCASASVFGITGMAAAYNHLKFSLNRTLRGMSIFYQRRRRHHGSQFA